MVIESRERRFGKGLGANMVELMALCPEVRLDVSQALTAGKLAHEHTNKLIPAARAS